MSIGQSGVGPQGLSASTLELLANPNKLEKTLQSLRDAQKQAQDVIALAGPASEIVTIRAEVDALKASAEEANAKALEDAAAIVEEANNQATLIKDKARQKAAEVANEYADEAAEKNKLLDERERAIAAVESKLDQRKATLQGEREQITRAQDQLDARGAELDARSVELDDLNASLLQEKTKLAELREHLTSALG